MENANNRLIVALDSKEILNLMQNERRQIIGKSFLN